MMGVNMHKLRLFGLVALDIAKFAMFLVGCWTVLMALTWIIIFTSGVMVSVADNAANFVKLVVGG